jgi:2',3'-cyclic-nucleotide 2'-phosphodiesterase (5'-nucleotidase family)
MQRWSRLVPFGGIMAALWLAVNAAAVGAPRPTILQVSSELTTKNARTEESSLADIIADALRDTDKSDAAFVPASSFADTTLGKGNATVEDVLKALEYRDDNVMIVKLTGAQIKKALEHGLALYPQKNMGFLQVSGITANIEPAAEKDHRVVSVKVGRTALKDDKTYTVAMPSPLANGALGYFKVWDKTKAIDHDTNKTLAQAVTDYLSGMKTLGAKGEERLVIKK